MSKSWLDHSLKSAVSEHPSTCKKLKVPKHFWYLHESTFIIIFHHFEGKGFGKYLPYLSLRSLGCLLTHGLPITSILFRTLRISSSPFKCDYLKNKKHFISILLYLWNFHQILNFFRKKKIVIANVFRN